MSCGICSYVGSVKFEGLREDGEQEPTGKCRGNGIAVLLTCHFLFECLVSCCKEFSRRAEVVFVAIFVTRISAL